MCFHKQKGGEGDFEFDREVFEAEKSVFDSFIVCVLRDHLEFFLLFRRFPFLS